MSGVHIDGVTKWFSDHRVLDDIVLSVPDGSRTALLGRSGSGKSTLLRIVAGLARPDAGRIHLGDVDVTDVPPERRGVGVVFQHHALFPHLDVSGNVAFGLRMRRIPRSARDRRVAEILDLLQLSDLGGRDPATLSGGEAQRVAIARALAPSPRVLLLDEPFGALDQALRERLVADLAAVFEEIAVTAIVVTHDPTEASALATDLAVLVGGRIVQSGATAGVMARPRSVEVAGLLGHRNVVAARSIPGLPDGDGMVLVPLAAVSVVGAGEAVRNDEVSVDGAVEAVLFRGGSATATVSLPGGAVVEARLDGRTMVSVGDVVSIAIRNRDVVALSHTEC